MNSAATWVVGDIHGCDTTLAALLERLDLEPGRDQLILVGDLVNRGPASLAVLRRARQLEDRLQGKLSVVLGNHDLHLLGVLLGTHPVRPHDRFDEILAAPDRDDLTAWLQAQRLLVEAEDAVVVHAGLDPGWSLEQARAWAAAGETMLRGAGAVDLLGRPSQRSPLQRAVATLTRVRTWDLDRNEAQSGFSGPPEEAPARCVPWYDVPGRRTRGRRVVFGHWAAHGRRILDSGLVVGLDSGCAWGGELSALRLGDLRVVAEPYRDG